MVLGKQCLPWHNSYAMFLSLRPKEGDKPRFKGLVTNIYNACSTLYPILNFGLVKSMTWFEYSRWGFNTMQLEHISLNLELNYGSRIPK